MKKWYWDKKRRRYIDPSGDQLTDKEIQEGLDRYIESTQKAIATKVAQYALGVVTISTLFASLREAISALHRASGSIAYGGLEQVDITKWSRIEERLEAELGYLAQFQQDVAQAASVVTPEQLSTEAITARAELYPEAAYSEYMNQVVAREKDEGVTLGRRICEEDGASCDGCIAAATEDYLPLNELLDIGDAECMSNCRCTIEFSYQGVEPLSIERDAYATVNILEAIPMIQ